jgi:Right handed beta helix region
LVLLRLRVSDVGPRGNRDGIKLSGVEDFRVEGCTVERWGDGGSAIDMVGCRKGTIEGCTFRRPADEPGSQGAGGSNGVQAKGASRDVVIRRNRFENAGGRAVNVGGSTGLDYFRPPLAEWKGERWESKDIRVEGNTILGSQAPVAFVGADGGVFRFNTVHLPGRWALRILQENRAEGFVPSRGGEFTDNLVVFRSGAWSEGGVNVGPGTEPATFRFARNFWFCEDAPGRTRDLVRLPAEEKDGVHGKDPRLRDAAAGDCRPAKGSPAERHGAEALRD